MTEEEIKALQEAKEAAERRASDFESAIAQIKSDADKAKEDLIKVVDELKVERQKKQEALGKVTLQEGTDVNAAIAEALRLRDEESRKQSFKEALEEFKNSKPEFQNDAAGIVFSKFQNGLGKFNFSDIQSKEQMKSRLDEVYKFLNFTPDNNTDVDYQGSPQSHITPQGVRDTMSHETKDIIKKTGIAEDKFKTLKDKYPEAFVSLGIN